MTITLDVPMNWEIPLQNAARQQGKAISEFLTDGIRQQLRRDILPEAETQLLEAINAPLAPEARAVRDALLTKQAEGSLTEAEQSSLTETIDAVEIANAQRWQAIAELAARRGLSLVEMASALEIPLS